MTDLLKNGLADADSCCFPGPFLQSTASHVVDGGRFRPHVLPLVATVDIWRYPRLFERFVSYPAELRDTILDYYPHDS